MASAVESVIRHRVQRAIREGRGLVELFRRRQLVLRSYAVGYLLRDLAYRADAHNFPWVIMATRSQMTTIQAKCG